MEASVERRVEYQNTTPEAMHAEAWNLIWSMETPSCEHMWIIWTMSDTVSVCWRSFSETTQSRYWDASQECSCNFRYHVVLQLMNNDDTASNFPQNGCGSRTSMWSDTFSQVYAICLGANEQNPKKRHQWNKLTLLQETVPAWGLLLLSTISVVNNGHLLNLIPG